MKVIKIENCTSCPLSEIACVKNGRLLFIGMKCCSASNLYHDDEIIDMEVTIPDWCPLDDA